MNDTDEQPGQELAPDGQAREITHYSDAHVSENPYYQSFDETGKEAVPTTNYTQIANIENPPESRPKRSRRRLWLALAGGYLSLRSYPPSLEEFSPAKQQKSHRRFNQGAHGIIDQASNDTLMFATPGNTSNELAATSALSRPTGFTVPTISKDGSFAAFSSARQSDALRRVNVYILFIDASSNINVLRNSASGWQLTQPAASKAVESDSDIACLTMATTYFDSNGSWVLLRQALGETRCYFQKDGMVREVMLSGDDWVDLGSVPMP